MTPEAWTAVVVGTGLAGLVSRMDAHVRDQGERPARLAGKVDTLISYFGKRGEDLAR